MLIISIGKRLRELRLNKGYKMTDLKKLTGISTGNLSDLERDISLPSAKALISLSREYNVSTDYILFGKEKKEITVLTLEEEKILTKFNNLPTDQKQKVLVYIDDMLIISEYRKNEMLITIDEDKILESENTYMYNKEGKNIIPILGKTAAGPPIEPIAQEPVYISGPSAADYALIVKGNSMHPTYPDGSIIYLKSQPVLENGELGIIEIDGEVTFKKFYKCNDHIELVSLNPDYPIKKFNQKIPIKIIGKVI